MIEKNDGDRRRGEPTKADALVCSMAATIVAAMKTQPEYDIWSRKDLAGEAVLLAEAIIFRVQVGS